MLDSNPQFLYGVASTVAQQLKTVESGAFHYATTVNMDWLLTFGIYFITVPKRTPRLVVKHKTTID